MSSNSPDLSNEQLQSLLETAVAAARTGARVLLQWRGRFTAREKATADFVTDADFASQEAIRQVLSEAFPQHAFLGEESPSTDWPADDRPVWIVDPLDGTTNYLHGFPFYCVSVAVAQAGEILAGAIIDPLRNEEFRAALGQGAWLGQEKLATSGTTDLGGALVAVSLPPRVQPDSPDMLDLVGMTPHCRAVRRSGSAALNLAYVACGRLDAFWARQINAWDMAAGKLLITEAGGAFTASDGSEFDLLNPHFATSATRQLHQAVVEQLGSG